MASPSTSTSTALLDGAADPRVESLQTWISGHGATANAEPQAFLEARQRRARELGSAIKRDPVDIAAARSAAMTLVEGVASMRLGRAAEARRLLRRAERSFNQALPRAITPGVAPLVHRYLGLCRLNLGNVEYGRGAYADALAEYSRARDVFRFLGEKRHLATALGNIAAIHGMAGFRDIELATALEARQLAAEFKQPATLAHIDQNLGNTYRQIGDLPAARQALERALEAFVQLRQKAEELQARIGLATVKTAEDKPLEAIRLLEQTAGLARAVDRAPLHAARLAELAKAQLAHGATAEAAVTARAGLEHLAGVEDFDTAADLWLVVARAQLAEENEEAATEAVGRSLRALRRTGLPNALEIEAHALAAECARRAGDWTRAHDAQVARHDAYVRQFNQQTDLRTRVLAVQHQLDLARAAAERERMERLRLEEALSEVAARLADANRVPRARSAEEVTADELRPLGLTTRESEVLLWVARGKTNDEIGKILARSLSAVKKHLESIYRKLGVENRLSAAAAVSQLPAGGPPAEDRADPKRRPKQVQ